MLAYSIENAVKLAKLTHSRVNQSRKYTGDPYDVHPAEVASMAAAVYGDYQALVTLHVFLAVAWCHDTIEDTDVTASELQECVSDWPVKDKDQFITGVNLLTDPSDSGLNREKKLKLQADRLFVSPHWVQGIKLCDNYCNIRGIALHDPALAKIYLEEKKTTYDRFQFKHTSIRSFLDPLVEEVTSVLNSQEKCFNSNCAGKLVERLKDVHYIDNYGVIGRAKDIQGKHCTDCACVVLSKDVVTNRLRKYARTNPSINISD